jgi:hypothetical protein
MFTTIGLSACVIVIGLAIGIRRRRRRQEVEAQHMNRWYVEREAQRALAAADYAKFTERRRNGRPS